ncbi:MAG: domain, G-beta repeat [Sporomusa sp.]|jgi:WD40 repeat protein|nr:domain, G-beta repeat [Sporomusa sp.]
MALLDDDKDFLRQLAWIYPSDYMEELKELVEAVIKEQLATGERQNIRDIVWGIMDKIRAEASERLNEEDSVSVQAAQAEADREVREKVLAALSARQPNIPAGIGPEGIRPLIESLDEEDSDIVACAKTALSSLTDSAAIDAFCSEWAKTRCAKLEEILLDSGYLASRPLNIRLLTVLKAGADRTMLVDGEELVPELLAAVDDDDRIIAGRARRLLLTLTNKQAIDAVCETVLADADNERLKVWAVIARYAPSNNSRAAFYYAATGQWDKYYALDWQETRPLLAKGYSIAGSDERQRFLAVVRKDGQSLLLAGLLLESSGQNEYEEITTKDWDTMLELLVSQERWFELYRLLFRAPVNWAAEIVLTLKSVGWQPRSWERLWWEKILVACPQTGKEAFVPDGRETSVLEFDATNTVIECAAFHPNGRVVAGGGQDGRLRLWQIGSSHIWRTVDLHADAITAIAFTPDGRYLATAGREGKAHIWRLPEVKWVSSVNGQPGLVTSLEAGHGGNLLATAHASGAAAARVWGWDGTYMINQGQYPGSVFGVAAVNARQRVAVGGGRDGRIRVYALTGSKCGNRSWTAHTGAVESLKLSSDGRLVISAGVDGVLRIWHLADGQLLWSMPQSGKLLAVSYDGSFVAIGKPEQGMISLKQLRMVKPMARATHADWRQAEELMALPELVPVVRQAVIFLDTLMAGKFRYDIML